MSTTGSAVVVVGGLGLLSVCAAIYWRRLGRRGAQARPDKAYTGKTSGVVASIRVYPIKSCAGHEVTEAHLGRRGLEFDRLWMVVDANNRFMTQRRCPKMALIRPSLPHDENEPLVLSAEGVDSVEVPVVRPSSGAQVLDVVVWRDTCTAVDQGAAAAQWLSNFLEQARDHWTGASTEAAQRSPPRPRLSNFRTYCLVAWVHLRCPEQDGLRLVRMEDRFVRTTDPKYGWGGQTGFADGFPILLAAESSLADLNSRMAEEETISMDRFRPNLVVRGWGAWEEDTWTRIRVGNVGMRVVKPCGRCQIPSINQQTLEKREEPNRTLKTFRQGPAAVLWPAGKWAQEIFFGQNVVHESLGQLAVGDWVEVLRVARAGACSPEKEE